MAKERASLGAINNARELRSLLLSEVKRWAKAKLLVLLRLE